MVTGSRVAVSTCLAVYMSQSLGSHVPVAQVLDVSVTNFPRVTVIPRVLVVAGLSMDCPRNL